MSVTVQQLVVLKNVEALRSLLSTLVDKQLTDENLIWATNMYDAACMFDGITTKDLAEMLRDGCEPKNTLDVVQEMLDTMFEDDSDELTDEERTIMVRLFVAYIVGDVYGCHTLAQEIRGEYDPHYE